MSKRNQYSFMNEFLKRTAKEQRAIWDAERLAERQAKYKAQERENER